MELDFDELLIRFKNPKYKGEIYDGDCGKSFNESCGDNITMCIKQKNGKIIDAKYNGTGCAISQVCADKLAEYLIGKKTMDIKNIDYEMLKKITGINPSISRVKCVKISLDALKEITL